ncbi:MAG: peptide chain release factor-like protein [Acidimicrobiales bacterium]
MASHDRTLFAGPGCRIPSSEIAWRFGPTGGPGGQHANRAHTRVEATINLATARGINDDVRTRLVARLGTEIKVTVDKHRSQSRNRDRAIDLLQTRLQEALVTQKRRRPTRPGRGATERRLKAKKQQSQRKANRRNSWGE